MEVDGGQGWGGPHHAWSRRWTQVRGCFPKLIAASELCIVGTATVTLFIVSLVGRASRRRGRERGGGRPEQLS